MLFCSIASFFVFTCVILYTFVFRKFYRSKDALEGSLTVTADLATRGAQGCKNPLVMSRLIASIALVY
jgi:hypothetical protein